MSAELWSRDAWEIADQVRSGEVAAKEVLEVFLERIEAHNEKLNAFVHLDFEGARAQAAEIDRRVANGEDPGPLAGIPVGVKDLEDVAGMPTTHGSLVHKGFIADSDSTQVTRLRSAGCVMLGKTAAPEFGSAAYTSTPLHGTTRNPWNLERTPGGSSGGSAAAVAAALVPIATASDGGGSTRIPASYSGLFGPKGTFGRVPRGRSPESSYTSVHGPISRSVRDSARFYDCVVGPDERDHFSLPHPGLSYENFLETPLSDLKAVWTSNLGYGITSREVEEISRLSAEAFASAGAFELVERPFELRDSSLAWGILGAAESWIRHEPYWDERKEDLTPIVRLGVEAALDRLDVKRLADAHRRRWSNDQVLAQVFDDVDLIVTPTTPTTAFAAEGPMPTEIDGVPIKPMHAIAFTYPFNVSGHPAVSVPCGVDSQGMPVGLHFVSKRHNDHLLLAIAHQFERFQPWVKIAPEYQK